MTIFVEDKLKPGVVGKRLADASDIEATADTSVQDEINSLKTNVGNPVGIGQTFRFPDGGQDFVGLVFATRLHTVEIAFSGGDLDIPGVPAGPFHTVGAYLVSQYAGGFVFSRVTSSSAVADQPGDIEATVVSTVSFADGGSFTVPNSQSDVRLGVMHSVADDSGAAAPDATKAVFVSQSGNNDNDGRSIEKPKQTIAAALTAARAISGWVCCLDGSEFSIGNLILNNGDKIYAPKAKLNGDISGPVAGSVDVIAYNHTGLLGVGTGDRFVFDYHTGALTVQGVAHDNSFLRCGHWDGAVTYDTVATGTVHFEVGFSNVNFETGAPNGLALTGYVGGNFLGQEGGIEYTSPTPADNELLAGTGEADEAQASGITLNDQGNIPFNNVGSGDVELSGGGGVFTITADNINAYRDRTIFVNHTSSFTLNIRNPGQFRAADVPLFRLRIVNLTDNRVTVQSTVSSNIGGESRQMLEKDDSLLIELPPAGEDWPVLSEAFGSLTARLIRGFQAVTGPLTATASLNAHHLRKDQNDARTVTIEDGLRSGSYFYFQNRGVNALTVDTAGSETIEGQNSFEVDTGYLYLVTKDNAGTWRLFLINREQLIENGVPRYDSLAPGKAANPGTATQEFLTFRAEWSGNRSLSMAINGQSIAAFATAAAGLAGGQVHQMNYAITQSEWAAIYTPAPANLNVTITDSSSSEVLYQTLARAS